jgi:hypothetical protein
MKLLSNQILIFFFVFVVFVSTQTANAFSFSNIFEDDPDDININSIMKNVKAKMEQDKIKKNIEYSQKMYEEEQQLKLKLSNLITKNIEKQLKIDEENNKLKKYYEITKQNNRKKLGQDENEVISQYVEGLLNTN